MSINPTLKTNKKKASQVALLAKNLAASTDGTRDKSLGSIPGWGRSPGGGHGNPLQSSYR